MGIAGGRTGGGAGLDLPAAEGPAGGGRQWGGRGRHTGTAAATVSGERAARRAADRGGGLRCTDRAGGGPPRAGGTVCRTDRRRFPAGRRDASDSGGQWCGGWAGRGLSGTTGGHDLRAGDPPGRILDPCRGGGPDCVGHCNTGGTHGCIDRDLLSGRPSGRRHRHGAVGGAGGGGGRAARCGVPSGCAAGGKPSGPRLGGPVGAATGVPCHRCGGHVAAAGAGQRPFRRTGGL